MKYIKINILVSISLLFIVNACATSPKLSPTEIYLPTDTIVIQETMTTTSTTTTKFEEGCPKKSPFQKGTPQAGLLRIGEPLIVRWHGNCEIQICVLQVFRGNDAIEKIAIVNNPQEGMEYILILLRLIYSEGPTETPIKFERENFVIVSLDEEIELLENAVIQPNYLDISVYPPSNSDGWLSGEVYKDDFTPRLVFGSKPTKSSPISFLLQP